MDTTSSILEIIDLRSFSNLWFWIALAVTWSTASHWVLGVPYDMVLRARRKGGEAEEDMVELVRINVNRILYISHVSGLILVGVISFALTALALLGFVYGVEFAQALFLLGAPMSLVWWMTARMAARIRAADPEPPQLYRFLNRHRMMVQGVGVMAILVTSMWGMYRNFSIGVLGN